MSADDGLGPRLRAAGARHVPLGAAVSELRRAWAAADDEARLNRGEGMLRLREVNLVIYAAGEAEAEPARKTAARFAREHPGRVILLVSSASPLSRGDAGSGPAALVSTECFVEPRSGCQVCSEMVVIGAGGEEERAARAIVSGLLVPDLPVVGWWSGPVSPLDPSLLWLAQSSDQLVVDSERVVDAGRGPDRRADGAAGLRALANLVQSCPETQVRDLSWLRVGPWCGLTAELFDNPERRGLIPRVNRLRVHHRGALSQALLYSAWFGSRLGLNVVGDRWERDAARCATLRGGQRVGGSDSVPTSIAIELCSRGAGGGSTGGLAEVSVHVEPPPPEPACASHTGEGTETAGSEAPAVSLRWDPRSQVCSACVADGEGEVMVKAAAIASHEDWRLLCQILEAAYPDALFADAVVLAAALGDTNGALPGGPLSSVGRAGAR